MSNLVSDLSGSVSHSYIDNVGHGLKTPLNSINALSSLLLLNEQKNLTEDQLDQLSVIHRSGELLASLLDDLVSLVALQETGLVLSVDDLVLHALVSVKRQLLCPVSRQLS